MKLKLICAQVLRELLGETIDVSVPTGNHASSQASALAVVLQYYTAL